MEFDLTEEQRAYQSLAQQFARTEIAPQAEFYDHSGEYPRPIVEKAFDAGLMYANVPEKWGGAGVTLLEECLITEELAWGCAGITGSLTISNIPALGMMLAGSEEQCARFLGEAIEGRQVMAYALSEPGAGSDVKQIRTTARRVGDEYSISGSKCFISSAGASSKLLLFTVTDATLGHRGISTFLIPTDRAGVTVGPAEKKMGQTASHIHSIYLDDVKATKEELIGGEGAGFKLAMEVFNQSRNTIAIQGVGVARRAMEEAAGYANERRTMGRAIIEHQAVGFMLADMDIQIAAARHLVMEAAWLADRKQPNSIQAARAKCYAADVAMKVTTDAVQIFGGYGYMKEYPVEKLMRDAKVIQIYEGTSQIQRIIVSRGLMTARRSEAREPAASKS
jgi:acyl-CoA dehydrogenase